MKLVAVGIYNLARAQLPGAGARPGTQRLTFGVVSTGTMGSFRVRASDANGGQDGGVSGASDHGAELPPVEVWLEGVGVIARSVASSSSLSAVLDLVAETCCRLMGYEFCAVLLADDARERLVIEGSHGLSTEYVGSVNEERPIQLGPGPLGEGPSSRAFISGEPAVVTDVGEDASFGPWAGVAFDQGYESMIAVPIAVAGRSPVGTLNCYTAASHDFPSAEVSLLCAMANQAAIAIERARMRIQEQAQVEHLRQLNRSLEAQRSTLHQAEKLHRELTDVTLAEKGLPAVAAVLSQLLGVTIVIEDAEGRELGAAVGKQQGPRIHPKVIQALPGVADALAGIESTKRILEFLVEEPGQKGTRKRRMRMAVAPVILGGRLAARIWALCLDSDLGPVGQRALEHAAIVVAQELLKLRAAQEAEWRLRSDLFSELFDEPRPRKRGTATSGEREAVLSRAAQLGHDLTLPHTILLVRFDKETVTTADKREERTGDAFRTHHSQDLLGLVHRLATGPEPRPLVAARSDTVAVLVPKVADPPWGSIASLAKTIVSEAVRTTRQTVSVVIGGEIAEYSRYPSAYRQARGALELVLAQGASDAIVSIDDLGVYALLLLIDEPEVLLRFAKELLDPIEDYDRRYHAELEETLRAYLDHGLRMQGTASALYVHVNTLFQRLRRIEEILHADLRNPQVLLKLQLALMIKNLSAARSEP